MLRGTGTRVKGTALQLPNIQGTSLWDAQSVGAALSGSARDAASAAMQRIGDGIYALDLGVFCAQRRPTIDAAGPTFRASTHAAATSADVSASAAVAITAAEVHAATDPVRFHTLYQSHRTC